MAIPQMERIKLQKLKEETKKEIQLLCWTIYEREVVDLIEDYFELRINKVLWEFYAKQPAFKEDLQKSLENEGMREAAIDFLLEFIKAPHLI